MKKRINCTGIKKAGILFLLMIIFSGTDVVRAQTILFDFDGAPPFTPLPINQTSGGLTAYLVATGSGYSIQAANVLGFTPQGFSGNILYPNSINQSDLLIKFDQTLSDFSILYACQELGCDDAATMRVTAYMGSNYVGTNTRTATFPGTWPSDTLSCSFSQVFDSVVVHYDHRPPTCADYGVIYLADNMTATLSSSSAVADPFFIGAFKAFPNPVSSATIIRFDLVKSANVTISVFDMTGRKVTDLFSGPMNKGPQQIQWDVNAEGIAEGLYLLLISDGTLSRQLKLVVE